MKVVSRIKDNRINADNVLIEVSIKEYVEMARHITDKNEFQRRRVDKSSTVYALLREDLKSGCTIPPIVLAVRIEHVPNNTISDAQINDEQLKEIFKKGNLIILDGLQRTYTILSVIDELLKSNDALTLEKVYQNTIRVEIYIGLNKIGILYRMLSLNTGQTPMSIRHQIEMLYSDYLENTFDGISLIKDVEKKPIKEIGQYKFQSVIEGFNSYLDGDELGINRGELLENIRNLERLSKENNSKDLFKDFINTYNNLLKQLDKLTESWQYDGTNKSVFGKNIVSIFSNSQPLTGFGSAISKLKERNLVNGFEDIQAWISEIKLGDNSKSTMTHLLEKLHTIRTSAKNIGAEQRLFFHYIFRELFNKESYSYLDMDKSIENGFNKYNANRL